MKVLTLLFMFVAMDNALGFTTSKLKFGTSATVEGTRPFTTSSPITNSAATYKATETTGRLSEPTVQPEKSTPLVQLNSSQTPFQQSQSTNKQTHITIQPAHKEKTSQTPGNGSTLLICDYCIIAIVCGVLALCLVTVLFLTKRRNKLRRALLESSDTQSQGANPAGRVSDPHLYVNTTRTAILGDERVSVSFDDVTLSRRVIPEVIYAQKIDTENLNQPIGDEQQDNYSSSVENGPGYFHLSYTT